LNDVERIGLFPDFPNPAAGESERFLLYSDDKVRMEIRQSIIIGRHKLRSTTGVVDLCMNKQSTSLFLGAQ
jgi:hypothetical protein